MANANKTVRFLTLGSSRLIAFNWTLAAIECGYKVLTYEIEIAPVFQRLPECFAANVFICFMALNLYRLIRYCLKLAGSGFSPEAALEGPRRVPRHTLSMNALALAHGNPAVRQKQHRVLAAHKFKKSASETQTT